jgi:hypothetical protein
MEVVNENDMKMVDKECEEMGDKECEEMGAKESEEMVDNPEDSKHYPAGSYFVAVYQDACYIGQFLGKKNETNALPVEAYIYVSFMQRVVKDIDHFKWPDKVDKLNTLKEDVLFACGAPNPSKVTSSSRSITYSLSKSKQKKANSMILSYKAYYHIKMSKFNLVVLYVPVCRGGVVGMCVLGQGCMWGKWWGVCVWGGRM